MKTQTMKESALRWGGAYLCVTNTQQRFSGLFL